MICGIDEAGRGPLAGPLVMAACVLRSPIEELNDSKKLSEKKREKLYEILLENSDFALMHFSPHEIDLHGLSWCLATGLKSFKTRFENAKFIFDGNSNFGIEGIKTLIKADTQIPEVMAASILAKVSRDRIMLELDKKYPEYNFASHKGYPSKEHYEKIAKFGASKVHRKSFKGVI